MHAQRMRWLLALIATLVAAPTVRAEEVCNDPYAVRLGVGHDVGPGIGYPDSYTTFEAFIPLIEDSADSLIFSELQYIVNNMRNLQPLLFRYDEVGPLICKSEGELAWQHFPRILTTC